MPNNQLLTQLNNTGLANKDPQLFQLLSQIIKGSASSNPTNSSGSSGGGGGGGGTTGITQLTGDVTAGPGVGSQVATLADTAVTPGTYGDDSNVPQITIDSKGRITNAVNVPLSSSLFDFVVASDGGIPVPSPLDDGAGSFIYVPYTP